MGGAGGRQRCMAAADGGWGRPSSREGMHNCLARGCGRERVRDVEGLVVRNGDFERGMVEGFGLRARVLFMARPSCMLITAVVRA
jgi:hypothetical protein